MALPVAVAGESMVNSPFAYSLGTVQREPRKLLSQHIGGVQHAVAAHVSALSRADALGIAPALKRLMMRSAQSAKPVHVVVRPTWHDR